MTRKLRNTLIIGLIAISASSIAGDRSQEREDLVSILRELDLVSGVIERAADRHSGREAGVIFRYDLARNRIASLRRDIEAHIAVMDRTPHFERFED